MSPMRKTRFQSHAYNKGVTKGGGGWAPSGGTNAPDHNFYPREGLSQGPDNALAGHLCNWRVGKEQKAVSRFSDRPPCLGYSVLPVTAGRTALRR